MKKTIRVILLVLSMSALSFGARAAGHTVALLPPTGDSVAPSILQASRDLLKDHLQRTGVYTVVEPPAPPTPTPVTEEQTPAEAARVAQTLGAEQALVVRLIHLGSGARVRLTAYAAISGQVVYWDSLAITGGPEELDVAFQRLVHAMQVGKPVRDSAELETVTDKETQNLNRRNANKSFGVHILTLLPFNTARGSFATVTAGGLFWLYDARAWMADVAFDLGGGSGQSFYSAAIGGYYPLLREDFTPFVGGVVRWNYMNLGGGGAGGMTIQPTAGFLLGRLSSVQLRGDVGYFFNTFSERGYTSSVTGNVPSGPEHYSHGFVFTLGLGF